jgi:hypothetical protein
VSRIALSYEIPFVDSVTMPIRWARWLASQGSSPNEAIRNAPDGKETITWRYEEHGLLPWMQFFYDWRFADLTGDGAVDYVLTCGTMRQIAYRQDGVELWRYEDPSASFLDIRPDVNCPVIDIDGDGIAELVCPRRMEGVLHLCIVNARSGDVKNSVPYPDPLEGVPRRGGYLRGSITVINASGAERPSDILVCWDYRSVTLLDVGLNVVWSRQLADLPERRHLIIGHSPNAGDIDEDGCDEVLASSCLLDQDGTVLWVAPDLPALLADGHADSVQIVRLTEGERPNMVMSTGAYCFSAGGELLWGRDDLKHGQAQRVGKIRADVPGKQMVVYEGASRVDPSLVDRVIALDNTGDTLWDFEVVQPDMQEGGFGFWLGDWDGDGLDEVFVNGPQVVNVLDGDGTLIETIPGHLIYVFDLVGDSRAEAVVLTGIEPGMRLQIVENDGPNANPETNRVIEHRVTPPAMYNVTRY